MSRSAPFSRITRDVVLGRNVRLVGFVNLYGCMIGDECVVGPFVEIQRGVRIGRRVKIESHTFICSGVEIQDEVFVGHGVTFVNDRYPRSTGAGGRLKTEADWKPETIVVERGASLGSNATVLGGVRIGAGALVGAGSVVVKDVTPRAIVAGNPARVIRHLETNGDEELGRPARKRISRTRRSRARAPRRRGRHQSAPLRGRAGA